jgi:hypothetical protein
LAEALRANSRGLYCAEAAVWLLIGHQRWLHRGDFVGEFIETGQSFIDGTAMAFVDWPAVVAALGAGRLPCSDSEAQILRIAASIADGIAVNMREAVSGLDVANMALVCQAVLHAAGHREAGVVLAEASR